MEPAHQRNAAAELVVRSQIPAWREAREAALLATDASPCGASCAVICQCWSQLPTGTASLLSCTSKTSLPFPAPFTLAQVLHSRPSKRSHRGLTASQKKKKAGSYQPTNIFPFLLLPPIGSQVGSSGNKSIATNDTAFTISGTVFSALPTLSH